METAFTLLLAFLPTSGCRESPAAPLRLATTTSIKDSGLLDALLPAFKKKTGTDVGVVSVGTGLALKLAEHGEADVVITHDQKKEEAFIAAGHTLSRRVFATSDFVIVGPPSDPAGIRGQDAVGAFQKIAASRASFASRGDSSGTHSRELSLWKTAGLEHPAPPAYVEVRAGMQVTLQFASDKDAYTLSDRATYLAHQDDLRVEVLVQGDPRLENNYAVMVMNPAKHPEVDEHRAMEFADWLFSDEARRIIESQVRAGERLFRLPPPERVALGLGGPRGAQDLTVSAAVSLKEALGEIGPAFEAANPVVTVSFNLGASGDLQRQIEAGAPVDVFISAAALQMDVLEKRGAVDPRTRRDVACNRLVVVVPAEGAAPIGKIQDLASVEHVAVGNPKTVPAGQYAKEALQSAGQWEALQPKLVFGENVRQALDYVARGEAEAAFVYRTDANVLRDRVKVAFEMDPATHKPIQYPAAVVAGSTKRELARKFVDFLTSPAATTAFQKQGFLLPPCR
jgi:molybdenum ABC transporter molybdate-binding protein